MYLEAALRQFMGGAEARHTSAEDAYFLWHSVILALGTFLRQFGRGSPVGNTCWDASLLGGTLFRLHGTRGWEVS